MLYRNRTALVFGAGGFIGSHLVERLRCENFWVRGVDLKLPDYGETAANDFCIGDLRERHFVKSVFDREFDEIYQLAADMGGAGFIFSGENDADVMYNSSMINLNVVKECSRITGQTVFFASSACAYPEELQTQTWNVKLSEEKAYPANPDSEYGWEKLYGERIFAAFARNYGLNIRMARYHNVYGPNGTWKGGREKAPAAICRKIACSHDGGKIEIWGNGEQTRSFLFISDCIDGTTRLMRSDTDTPVNIGSEEMININELALKIAKIAKKEISIHHVEGPIGVIGRCSDNSLAERTIGWRPKISLDDGLSQTYAWITEQLAAVTDK